MVVYLLSPLSAEPACVIDHRHRHVISEPFLVAAKSNLWTKSESLRRLMTASVNEHPVHRLDFLKNCLFHRSIDTDIIKEIQHFGTALDVPDSTASLLMEQKTTSRMRNLQWPFVIIRQCRNADQQANKETIVPVPASATRLMVTNYRQEPC